ncbi:hypothetical protein PaG_06200 [Moesziomyces aphidis]|uniref:Uncharacterized protein n=1 Tax=Moesziomyces aphidis TaxID=84754 RepID=W3VE14_MOEAP|nr:hypothetical protein PaG_06200 [Moesziomyces aphidis]
MVVLRLSHGRKLESIELMAASMRTRVQRETAATLILDLIELSYEHRRNGTKRRAHKPLRSLLTPPAAHSGATQFASSPGAPRPPETPFGNGQVPASLTQVAANASLQGSAAQVESSQVEVSASMKGHSKIALVRIGWERGSSVAATRPSSIRKASSTASIVRTCPLRPHTLLFDIKNTIVRE